MFILILIFCGLVATNTFCLDYHGVIEFCLEDAKKTGWNLCYWPDCKQRQKGFVFKNRESLRAHLNTHRRKLEGRCTENDFTQRKAKKKHSDR